MKPWRIVSKAIFEEYVLAERWFDYEDLARAEFEMLKEQAKKYGGCYELQYNYERIDYCCFSSENE